MLNEYRERVLILTLFSGEHEIDQCIRSVEAQAGVECTLLKFSRLPNLEAHECVYKTVMGSREEYDYFVKLDADMVFKNENSLFNLLGPFRSNRGLDHLHVPVFDCPSQTQIMGLHIFSNRVHWKFPLDPLFPDSFPSVIGEREIRFNVSTPEVFHMPNPSIDQAYAFGFHRGLKVVQTGRHNKSPSQSRFQLRLLRSIWMEYQGAKDRTRFAILSGFLYSLENKGRYLDRKSELVAPDSVVNGASCDMERVLNKADAVFSPARWKYWSLRFSSMYLPWSVRLLRRLVSLLVVPISSIRE